VFKFWLTLFASSLLAKMKVALFALIGGAVASQHEDITADEWATEKSGQKVLIDLYAVW